MMARASERRLTAAASVLASLACGGCERPIEMHEYEFGPSVDLVAVTVGHKRHAVGSTYVFTQGDDALTWDLGVTLRDIDRLSDLPGAYEDSAAKLLVVGDGGFAALSTGVEAPFEFVASDTATSADLWAVVARRQDYALPLAVAVGPEVLVVASQLDEDAALTWASPPPPADGWGVLRDVAWTEDGACAIGDAGRVLCSTDEARAQWEVIDIGVSTNLRAFCPAHELQTPSLDFVGDYGVWAKNRSQHATAWEVERLIIGANLVACSWSWAIRDPGFVYEERFYAFGDDKTLYDQDGEALFVFDWQPLAADSISGVYVVGEGGRATTLPPDRPR